MRNLILFILLSISFAVTAQNVPKFKRYTTDDGLPANYVLDIYQDNKGFMWFGMRGGICRFDGFTFKFFPVKTHNGNEQLQTSITQIIEDNKKRLWIGEIGQFGLLLFDFEKEVFIDYTDKLGLSEQIKKLIVNQLFCDNNGVLWIGCEKNCIIQYNPETNETNLLKHDPLNSNSLPDGVCNDIIEDKAGGIWIATTSNLCKYNRESKQFTRYFSVLDKSRQKYVACIMNDSENNIFVGLGKEGVFKYNRERNNFIPFFTEEQTKFIGHVGSLTKDNENNMWIGTTNGVFVRNESSRKLVHYKHNETNQQTINSNIITVLRSDSFGNMWIGTGEGICKLKAEKFITFKYTSNGNSISQNKVQYITEIKKDEVWISVPDGINVYDRKNGQFIFFAGVKQVGNYSLLRPPITFCKDPGRGVWVGTYMGGFSFYDDRTKQFKHYLNDPDNPNSLSHNAVFTIVRGKNNLLWIGTYGGGINIHDTEKGTFEHILSIEGDTTSLPSNNIQMLHIDYCQNIWVGTINGIAVLEESKTRKFKRIDCSKVLSTSKEMIAFHFHDTKNGEYMWIATNLGLLLYHNPTKIIKVYTEKEGLPSSRIFGILEDNKNTLWISTSNGLVSAKPKYNSSEVDIKFRTYKKSDGLQGNEFLPASCCKLHDGSMMFGGTAGFSIFHPDSIKDNPIAPKLAFTNLEISNKTVHIGEDINGQIVLDKSISQKKHLILIHENNKFSIEFIALHFNQPRNNKYAYMLEGLDNKWLYTDAFDRKVDYMNLRSGEYIMKMKAANSDGLWNNKAISLKITVLPPWWRTWWFVIILIFLSALTIILIVRLRTIHLEKQKLKLKNIVEKRTLELKDMNYTLKEQKEELELQMEKMSIMNKEIESMAKQLHEADQSQLRFFANISHEFRTPLSLIITPLEKCLSLKQPIIWQMANISTYLQLMHKNATRLLRLINQVVDFRKIAQGRKKIKQINNNIIDFIGEVIEAFKPMAEAKSIHLSLNIEHLSKNIDHSKLKKENLTENNGQTNDEKFENNNLSNEEDQMKNDKYEMNNDKWKMINDFWFDPDVMEKILFNLISNAVKYTPEGGEILIGIGIVETRLIASLQNQLAIKISDTGIGISPENLDKIFDRFFRVEAHGRASLHVNQIEGTGIGLAYTKELVELHGGKIKVESQYGKGTVVRVSFPFGFVNNEEKRDVTENQNAVNLDYIKSIIGKEHYSEYPQMAPSLFSPPPIHSTTVLIVEDNVDLRTFIRGELESQYMVHEAENGKMGIEKANNILPDLIISDVMMPIMDGIDLCKRIKTNENTCHIPVILLTAKSNEEDILKGLETGADDYVTKPFKLQILLAKIKNILNIRQQLQEKFSTASLDISHKVSVTNTMDENFLKKATEIVKANIGDVNFDNDTFIKLMGMSRALIYKKIKVLTNQSIGEFIRVIKLKTAANLLSKGNNNISEVAYAVGYKYSENFSRHFAAFFQQTPSEYMRENKF